MIYDIYIYICQHCERLGEHRMQSSTMLACHKTTLQHFAIFATFCQKVVWCCVGLLLLLNTQGLLVAPHQVGSQQTCRYLGNFLSVGIIEHTHTQRAPCPLCTQYTKTVTCMLCKINVHNSDNRRLLML